MRSQLGFVPSSPMEPVTYGRSSGSAALPRRAFATPAPSRSAISFTSADGAHRALPDEHRDALASVQDLGRLAQFGLGRHDAGLGVPDRGVNRPVGVRRRLHRIFPLDVVGDDDAGHGALGLRDSHRAVDGVTHLRRGRDRDDVVTRHVLEEDGKVDLLLVVPADRRGSLLPDDGEDGRMVELGVVEAVQKVDRPGARGGEAHAHLAGPLCVAAGHEGGHLLVPGLDEIDLVGVPVERPEGRVDPVAGIAVDALHAPLGEPLEHEVGGGLAHVSSFRVASNRGNPRHRPATSSRTRDQPTKNEAGR